MEVQLLIIGSELLRGRVQERNLYTLANWCKRQGHNFHMAKIIPDDPSSISKGVEKALHTADLVVVSGGLGPTEDDLTKAAIAKSFNMDMVESSLAMEYVVKHYSRIGKTWTPATNHYHILPQGAVPIFNPAGLAPGIFIEHEQKIVVALPGVPREFEQMLKISLPDLIKLSSISHFPPKELQEITIRTRSIPEEDIFFKKCPDLWNALRCFGKIASLPSLTGVDIVVMLNSNSVIQDAKEQIQNLPQMKELLPYIWQWGNLSLPELLLQKANNLGIKIAIAESCTGGLIASRLTDIPGSSQSFLGSTVTYSNQAKQNILKVKASSLHDFGAVSLQVAKEMSRGVLDLFQADLAIATSGIAGPDGGSPEKPVGTLAVATSYKDIDDAKILQMRGDRILLKERFVTAALFKALDSIN